MTTTATAAAPAAAVLTPNVVQSIEVKVETFIQELVQGVEHELTAIGTALSGMFALIPAATAKLEALAPFIESMGAAAGQPEIVAGVAAADVAMHGLDQFIATYQTATAGGGITAAVAKTAVTDAYTAYRNVGATYNSVKATAVQIATQPAAPVPVITAPGAPAS
jgi:hypothetical protein